MTQSAQNIYVAAVGLAAPGLPDWKSSVPILCGDVLWQIQEMPRTKPALLPVNERRRATEVVCLAFQAGEEALAHIKTAGGQQRADMASVFASSGGSHVVLDQICRALSAPEREVSPTAFHNSVHNAPAGYWGIATNSQQPSSALSAFDATFAVGLLEAALLLADDQASVMLVSYDATSPYPLDRKRHITLPFASALILTQQPRAHDAASPVMAKLEIAIVHRASDQQTNETRMENPDLERLRLDNPAARCLPLLECLAKEKRDELFFCLPGTQILRVRINY